MVEVNYFSGLGHDSHNTDGPALSEIFAKRLTGEWKADASMLIVGERGSGKSYAAVSLAMGIASEVAQREGGTWEDYFDIDTHLAITDPRETIRIMTNLERYHVYILDDVGVSADSRRAMTKENVNLTQIFEICRIQHAALILTAPIGSLVDSRFRELVAYYGTMFRKFPEIECTAMKVYKVGHDFQGNKRLSKIRFRDKDGKRCVIAVYMVQKPPKFMCDKYDEQRLKFTQEAIGRMFVPKGSVPGAVGTEGIQFTQADMDYVRVRDLVKGGMSVTAACDQTGISRSLYNWHAARDPDRIVKRKSPGSA